MDISDIIKLTTDEFIKEYNNKPHMVNNAYDINNGYCEEFAMTVIEKMGGYSDKLSEYDLYNFAGTDKDPLSEEFDAKWLKKNGYTLPKGVTVEALNKLSWSHVIIKHNDKYYDAECSNGVNSPFALPLVINNLKVNGLFGKYKNTKGMER